MKVIYKVGNIVSAVENHIVCTVPAYGGFSGVAKQLAYHYDIGDLKPLLAESTVGDCISISFYDNFDVHKFFHFLVNKETPSDPVYLNQLRRTLLILRDHLKDDVNEVTEVAMPKIGSGADHIDWADVLTFLWELFRDTDITFVVYVLDASEIPESTEKPETDTAETDDEVCVRLFSMTAEQVKNALDQYFDIRDIILENDG